MSATIRPIIFSAPMARALLDGRKTQTRRIIKPRGRFSLFDGTWSDDYVLDPGNAEWRARAVRYAPGNLLWVREAFVCGWPVDNGDRQDTDDAGNELPMRTWFRADGDLHTWLNDETGWSDKTPPWRPSIHMPRWASRITLEVEAVRVERLQEISATDAEAEGVVWESADPPFWYVPGIWPHSITGTEIRDGAPACFAKLWNHLHGAGAWEGNPWVVALTFRVHRCNVDQLANR